MGSGSLREAIIAEAESWLGTPFEHAQRVKGAGVDCVQFIAAVYEAVGLLKNVRLRKYPPDWMLHRAAEVYLEGIRRVGVEVSHPEPGDLAVFRIGRAVSHAGIVVEWPIIIHAHGNTKVQREDVTQHPKLLRGFAGWWSIVEAARIAAAPGRGG